MNESPKRSRVYKVILFSSPILIAILVVGTIFCIDKYRVSNRIAIINKMKADQERVQKALTKSQNINAPIDKYSFTLLEKTDNFIFFKFMHSLDKPVSLWGFELKLNMFYPRFPAVETKKLMTDKEWRDIKLVYCATGAQFFEISPSKEYILKFPVYAFTESDNVYRVKISGEKYNFISSPFELNKAQSSK